MRKLMRAHWFFPLALILLGLGTRFLFIWHPAEVVFDEVHFGKFVDAYFTGKYYFDIHPPLGKLLVALAAYLGGYRSGFPFLEIGNSYGEVPYVAFRFLPNLAGGLIPFAAFLFFQALGVSRFSSFLASLVLVFENALLVQSHFILVDPFLILFGLLGLASFFHARNRGYSWKWLLWAGFLFSASLSIKWIGLGFFSLAIAVYFSDVLRRALPRRRDGLPLLVKGAVGLLFLPFLFYLSVFFVHFALLPHSGPGDAFMSQAFQKGEENFPQRFLELNVVMYKANATLSATHPYSSQFWSWPLMLRPVYYWVKDYEGGKSGRIYLLGNPLVWWLSSLGVLFGLFFWKPKRREMKTWLYLGYFLNWLPFALIGRVLFLYHYLSALVFAIAIATFYFIDSLGKARENGKGMIAGAIVLLALLGFLFFLPLSYGLPLSSKAYELRVWLPSWR